jgi:hypothetical protein
LGIFLAKRGADALPFHGMKEELRTLLKQAKLLN